MVQAESMAETGIVTGLLAAPLLGVVTKEDADSAVVVDMARNILGNPYEPDDPAIAPPEGDEGEGSGAQSPSDGGGVLGVTGVRQVGGGPEDGRAKGDQKSGRGEAAGTGGASGPGVRRENRTAGSHRVVVPDGASPSTSPAGRRPRTAGARRRAPHGPRPAVGRGRYRRDGGPRSPAGRSARPGWASPRAANCSGRTASPGRISLGLAPADTGAGHRGQPGRPRASRRPGGHPRRPGGDRCRPGPVPPTRAWGRPVERGRGGQDGRDGRIPTGAGHEGGGLRRQHPQRPWRGAPGFGRGRRSPGFGGPGTGRGAGARWLDRGLWAWRSSSRRSASRPGRSKVTS